VSRLETEGTLAKMVYLLTWLQLIACDLLKSLTMAIASIAAGIQGAAPQQAVSIGVKRVVYRWGNRVEILVADRGSLLWRKSGSCGVPVVPAD
jgi:hypothetical protein